MERMFTVGGVGGSIIGGKGMRGTSVRWKLKLETKLAQYSTRNPKP